MDATMVHMSLAHKISEGIYSYIGLYLLKRKPVLIYAPGRVGSMALLSNLRNADIFTFKVESFMDADRGSTHFVKKNLIDTKKPLPVITLVRDPVSMMVAYFFSKCIKGWLPEAVALMEQNQWEDVEKMFISHSFSPERFDWHLNWFVQEYEQFLQINVLNHTFDKNKKWSTVDDDLRPVLIIRSDLEDSVKGAAISSFLGLDTDITITRQNVGTTKPLAELRNNFEEKISLPTELLERIYANPCVTHFFTPEEIATLKQRWAA